jgi:hypothetical protein
VIEPFELVVIEIPSPAFRYGVPSNSVVREPDRPELKIAGAEKEADSNCANPIA